MRLKGNLLRHLHFHEILCRLCIFGGCGLYLFVVCLFARQKNPAAGKNKQKYQKQDTSYFKLWFQTESSPPAAASLSEAAV